MKGESTVIHDLKDINIETPEGRLLMAALAKITTESQRDKTPWQVIEQLNELKRHMFDESGTSQEAWDSLVAKTACEQQERVKCVKCGKSYRKGQVCGNCFMDENRPDE